ncbi:MAG: CofH family radical SAM protein [Spirochaetes bacterium]|nr:MAG: CofH family radical SAM protein [Spirochaetota bacterium]
MMDLAAFSNTKLRAIARKVLDGEPAGVDDAHAMLTTGDVLELGLIANHVRRALHGDRVYYGVNMNLNYTNVCELRCPLCAFSRDACDPDAYTFSLDEIEARVREAVAFGIDEVHIVGGINPALSLDYFFEMLRRIKRVKSDLFIVAFTAVEYDHFAKLGGMTMDELFKKFMDAGLGAIPGGGAEIFDEGVRTVLAPKKISGDRWLKVMRAAHRAGLKTNATMLYGHVEETEHLVDHMARIRALQDETGGFKTFVPLSFHEEHTKVRARRAVTGFDDLRVYAAARVFLHNVPHVKALWMYVGEKMAQVLLSFGVDDIGATYHYEKVVHAAGARTPDAGSEPGLRRLIENAGFVPVRSTARY